MLYFRLSLVLEVLLATLVMYKITVTLQASAVSIDIRRTNSLNLLTRFLLRNNGDISLRASESRILTLPLMLASSLFSVSILVLCFAPLMKTTLQEFGRIPSPYKLVVRPTLHIPV